MDSPVSLCGPAGWLSSDALNEPAYVCQRCCPAAACQCSGLSLLDALQMLDAGTVAEILAEAEHLGTQPRASHGQAQAYHTTEEKGVQVDTPPCSPSALAVEKEHTDTDGDACKQRSRRARDQLARRYGCPVKGCPRRYEAWRSLQHHLLSVHNQRYRKADYERLYNPRPLYFTTPYALGYGTVCRPIAPALGNPRTDFLC